MKKDEIAYWSLLPPQVLVTMCCWVLTVVHNENMVGINYHLIVILCMCIFYMYYRYHMHSFAVQYE